MENGYHLYDFRGELLREEPIEKFKQWQWRPRPPTLLSKDEQKAVRRNLREFSRVFEQEDAERISSADVAVVEARRQVLNEWLEWSTFMGEELVEEREALGLPPDPVGDLLRKKTAEIAPDQEQRVIEEIVEEVLEESEEIVN